MKVDQLESIKLPVLRRGQRKPYVKATNAEIARRVETVARLLGDKQATRTEIHDYCRQNYGVVWQTAERYVRRAQEFLLQRAGKTKEQVFSEAVVFNEGVLRNDKATIRERLIARHELNELFGIYPRRRTEISGSEAAPLAGKDVVIKWPHEIVRPDEVEGRLPFDMAAYRALCERTFGRNG
jgi:hypothetical protein